MCGLRRDIRFLREDRAFYARALEAAASFRPDVVYARDEYFTFAGLRLSRRLGVPLVLEVNGLLERDARTMYRSLVEPVSARLERVKLARANAIVVETPGLAELLAERGAPRSRLFVVPNTVPDARVVAEPRLRRDGPVVIGWIGHLMAWHADSLMILADVARRIVDEADVRFLIIGDGPRLGDVRDSVHTLGLDVRFEFSGSVPYEDVLRALEAISCPSARTSAEEAFSAGHARRHAGALRTTGPYAEVARERPQPRFRHKRRRQLPRRCQRSRRPRSGFPA